MKKFALLVSMLLVFAGGILLPTGGKAAQQGNYIYSVEAGKATIEKYTGNEADVTVPGTLGGYPVIALSASEDAVFSHNSAVQTVTFANGITTVNNAFNACPNLRSVVLPQNLKEVGRLFERCPAVTSVSIPASVTSMGTHSFNTCENLTAINVDPGNAAYSSQDGVLYAKSKDTLVAYPAGKQGSYTVPPSVHTIAVGAFTNCVSLTEIDLSSATTIGAYAFQYCYSLASVKFSDDTQVIPESAFLYCNSLIDVDLPSQLKRIAYQAFTECTSLEHIDLPDSLEAIEGYAFSGCRSLKQLQLPPNVMVLDSYAFENCTSLTSVTIPPSISTLFGWTFRGCAKLNQIVVDAASPYYTFEDGVLYSKDKKKLVLVSNGLTGRLVLPGGVQVIGKGAFSDCKWLTEVVLPDSVTELEYGAFRGCSALQNLTLGNGLREIGSGAFERCVSLRQITLPPSLESIGMSAFSECTSLESINIPGSVHEMSEPYDMFRRCNNLQSITVDAGNAYFTGENGMLWSKDLSTLLCCPSGYTGAVTLHTQTTSIWSVDDVTGLTAFVVPAGNTAFQAIDGVLYDKGGTELICYPAAKAGTFQIGKNVQMIDGFGRGCQISNITVDPLNAEFKAVEGVLYQKDSSANGWYLRFVPPLRQGAVHIAADVTGLEGAGMFYQNQGITEFIVDPANPYLFSQDGLLYFKGDTINLASCPPSRVGDVTLPEGTDDIVRAAFVGCTQVTSIHFPSSIHHLRHDYGTLTSLREVYFAGNAPGQEGNVFDDCSDELKIYVTATSKGFGSSWQGKRVYLYDIDGIVDVNFDPLGGSGVEGYQNIAAGSHIAEPTAPTREHYDFLGWFRDAACTQPWDFAADTVPADTTLYAGWAGQPQTISFDSQGGSTIEPTVVSYNELVTRPADPTREGYTFGGWYKEAAGTTAWNFATDKVTSDITLHAQWTANSYTVSYDSNGGTGGSTASSSHVYDTSRQLTVNGFTRTGYAFAGWATNPTGSVTYTNGQSVLALASEDGATITLYAQWTANTYTVSYDSNGGTGGSTASSSHVYDISRKLTDNGFSRTGYTFAGWATSTSGDATYTNGQSVLNLTSEEGATVTLYARWTANTYTVSYDSNGGTGGSTASSSHVYGTSRELTVNGFSRTGYAFAGWATSPTGSVIYTNGQSVQNLTSENGTTVTLYAQWTTCKYTITATANNTSYGSVSGGGSIAYGTSVTVTATPKTGYRFIRWLEGSTAVSSSASYTFTVTKARTLKAEFTPISYAIAVYANSTNYGTVSGGGNYSHGSTVTVRATPNTGCYFVRWLEGNTTVSASTNYTFTVIKDRTLKAEFARIDAPASPKVIATSYNSVKVTWSAVSGAGGYEVWRSTSSGSGYTLAATVPGTSATNTGLATGTTYYYKVRAYRTVSSVKVYGAYSSAMSAKPMLAATTNLKVTATTYSSIKLTWNATAGAGGYEVWRSTSSASGYRLADTVAGTNSTSTGLATGTTYYYKVRAYRNVNGVKVYGPYSSAVSAKPILAATTGLKVTATTYNSVKLTWTVTTGAGGYEVWRSTKAASGYTLAAAVAGTTSTNPGLATGTTYYYKVRAYRTVNGVKVYGAYSSVVSAKPSLTTPTGVKAARASASSIKVSWAAVAGAMRYEVWRATSNGGTYYKLPDTTTPSYTNTGLTTGKTYYYKVRACRVVNGVKVYGRYSAVVYARP